MGVLKLFRTAVAASRASAGWKRDLAMLQYRDSDLPLAFKQGKLPEGTIEYAREILSLNFQGRVVAKTRKQWAEILLPYRPFDSELTRGVNTQRALLLLETLSRARTDLPLDDGVEETGFGPPGRYTTFRHAVLETLKVY